MLTLAKLKRYLDPQDRIEEGSHYFHRLTVGGPDGGRVDPCIATITFGHLG